jgi:dTDP-4-dehydrorhamnose reductase
MKKRLFVTGASGLLGANLSLQASMPYDVTALSLSHPTSWPHCRNVIGDLTNNQDIQKILAISNPEIIIHSAALTDVERCEADPALAHQLNVEPTEELVKWAQDHHCTFVHISTDSVFDGRRGGYSEDDVPKPLNVYAQSKWEAEKVVRTLKKSIIVRTSFYGWSFSGKLSLAEWLLEKLAVHQAISTFTDVRFSPLEATDLASIILDLVEHQEEGTFHLGAIDACSKHEFAVRLAQAFGFSTDLLRPISVSNFAFKAQRPRDISLNVTKATQYLKRSMPTIEEGIKKFKRLLQEDHLSKLKGPDSKWLTLGGTTR